MDTVPGHIGQCAELWRARCNTSAPIRALLALVPLLAGHPGFTQELGKNGDAPCAAPPGTALLWKMPDVKFLVVGELHGTREIPKLFGELVKEPVRVAGMHLVPAERLADAAMRPSPSSGPRA